MNLKKVLVTSVSIIMALVLCTSVYADNISQIIGDGNIVMFIDVPNNHWAKNQIEYFAQQGIINGYTDGSFKPEENVTREEFCKLLVATFKQPLETPETPTFVDVHENHWSYPYIEVCKDFLTGYTNPFGGMPSFHPSEYATREDIAVALVRMLGFTAEDAGSTNYALYRFTDGSSITPGLLVYVSLACEKGLINGYTDGSFAPSKGITRAETVVLLNRATKQTVTDISAELEMTSSVLYSAYGKTATINVIAEEGTTVTVNGEAVKMSSNYYNEYEGNYVYKFEEEGTKEFVVEGKKAKKTKTIRLSAKYELGAPTLKITVCPATSDTEFVTIKGKVDDENDDNPSVTVNGKSVSVWYGDWSYEAQLTEGENRFVIIAENESGKTSTETRTIEFGVGAPTLKITVCPATSDTETVVIKGKVDDINDDNPSVTVNGTPVSVWYGDWSYETELKEGENEFEIIATNELGKSTTERRTITFEVDAPTLKITVCPATSDTQTVVIKGKVDDINDDNPSVTVNGTPVSVWYGDWSYETELKEGINEFEIVVTNDLGKSTVEERKIQFVVGTPEIQFINCPESTKKETITVKGKIKGENEGAMLFIDDEEVYVNYNGEFSKTFELEDGINTFEFRAVNEYGKETTVTKSITYSPEDSDNTVAKSENTVEQ